MTIDLQAREIQPLRQTYTHVAKYVAEGKTATRYQEATMGAQPTSNFHYRPTWAPNYEIFDASRSAVKLKDWYVLTDPRQLYYGTWTLARAKQQDAMEASYQFVESRGLMAKMPDAVRALACDVLMPLRHVAWGGNMNNCSICAYGYGTALTAAAMFHALDHLGAAQYLTRLGLASEEPNVLDAGKNTWLNDPQWQVLRRYVEDTFVVQDPIELFVAQNFALDAQLYPLIYNSFVDEKLSSQGGTAISMLTSFMPEWHEESTRWVDSIVKTIAAESDANRTLVTKWIKEWAERAHGALAPIAQVALQTDADAALQKARGVMEARAKKAGIVL
jgi:phenol/toluene 2-monooxygenase (NADH) P1/A1